MKNRKKLSKKAVIIIVAAAIVAVLFVIPFSLAAIVYTSVFSSRFTTRDYLRYDVSEFEGLIEERMTFETDKGRKLQGYLYSCEGLDAKGVVVVCHGFGGGGCNQYMDSACKFVKNGYYTFMFDATANDLSEGSSTVGVLQYTVDLDHAVSFVRAQDRLKDLPVMLFGHSMGGFSVCNVLNFRDDISAVAELSGFTKSTDVIVIESVERFGKAGPVMLPYVKLYESLLFGSYAKGNAITGLRKAGIPAMIVHSSDDNTIPVANGYDKFYKEFSSRDDFTFILYENHAHNYVDFSDETLEYVRNFNESLQKWNEENPSAGNEAALAYLSEHLDRGVWCDGLDDDLYADIIEMFDKAANASH